MTDLKQRLELAADDTGRAFSTDLDDLLDRARRARRRDRVARGFVATAAVAAVAVVAPVALGRLDPVSGPVVPAGTQGSGVVTSTATPSPTSTGATVLSESEIVSRCASQLEKYNELPRWRGGAVNPVLTPVPLDAWFVVNEGRTSYRAGDVVAIGETRDNGLPRPCLIPQPGHEDDPVPFDAFVPTAENHDLITQVCSEAEVVSRRGAPDVRDADVLVAHRAGEVLVATLSRGDDYFTCTVPVAGLSDRVGFETRGPLRPARELRVALGAAAIGPKGGRVSSVYYTGSGFLPKDVATLLLEVRGQAPVEFPLREGAYAVALEVPITRIAPARVTLLDADGRILDVSPWS